MTRCADHGGVGSCPSAAVDTGTAAQLAASAARSPCSLRHAWWLLLLVFAAGCGNRVLNRSELADLRLRWNGNRLEVANPTAAPVRDVRIVARFYQREILPHTLGYAQYATPAGWYVEERVIPMIEPGRSVTVGFSANVGPDSQPMGYDVLSLPVPAGPQGADRGADDPPRRY